MTKNNDDFLKRINNIPQKLRSYPQWVCYRLEDTGKSKPDKIPYDPKTGKRARANDPRTCGTFEQACKAARNGKYDGIGFVFFDNDPFTGIDLDHCVQDGVILPWAQKIIDQLNSYSELSPSVTGVHVYVEAIKPIGRCRKGNVEIYTRGRFLTVTGNWLPDTPAAIEKRQRELDKVHAETFENHSGISSSASKPTPNPELTTISNLSDISNLSESCLSRSSISGTSGHSESSLSDAELLDKAMSAKNGHEFKALSFLGFKIREMMG